MVDGASDDGTVELLEGREDPHLTWISEPDSGQTEAVNKGLRLARGDLLAWVNADDAYVPEAVDRAIEHLERNPGTRRDLRGGQLHRRARRGLSDARPAEVQLADVPLLRRLRHHPDDHLAPRAARPGSIAERALRGRRGLRLLPAAAARGAGRPDRGAATQLPLPPELARRRPTSGCSSNEAMEIRLRLGEQPAAAGDHARLGGEPAARDPAADLLLAPPRAARDREAAAADRRPWLAPSPRAARAARSSTAPPRAFASPSSWRGRSSGCCDTIGSRGCSTPPRVRTRR